MLSQTLKKLILLPLLLFSLSLSALPSNVLKQNMLQDLDHIQQTFAIKYAPLLWKEQYNGWSLEREITKAKSKLKQLPSPTVPQFQKIVKEFFQSMADYHVDVTFYATARAYLDFDIKGAEGSYFISDIDRHYLPLSRFPFKVGDQILSFNGKPIAEAVADFKNKNFPAGNTPGTDQALAECYFTKRLASKGHEMPDDDVEIEVRKKDGTRKNYKMHWAVYKEKIGTPGIHNEYAVKLPGTLSLSQNRKEKGESFLTRLMCTPHWLQQQKRPGHIATSHEIGARTSFLPTLGRVTWASEEESFFDAYIFLHEGREIGYIRLAHYLADESEVQEFAEIMALMEEQTDALVIDQVNNPGGSACYLYALASLLTDRPLSVPRHHISLTQDDIFMATFILESLEEVNTLKELREVLGENLGGYPITLELAQNLKEHCHMIIREWNEGRMVTRPTYLLGIEKIDPSENPYTKPILLLINELDFSGGDFFPAIMQDNQRALIVGQRTAGAGGYFLNNQFYNRSSIESFSVTGSLAIRDGGDPLENLGVEPDIKLELTANDLQHGYKEYKESILSLLDQIIEEE